MRRALARVGLLGRAVGAGLRRGRLPYKLTLMVTGRCNHRCRICRIWTRTHDELTLDELQTFFSRSAWFSWIDVTGGEIFLRRDLVGIFEGLLGKCRRLSLLHFPTNGLLTDEIVAVTRELLAMGPPRLVVTVSIDGPPATHDALRGVEGSFERAVETLIRLRELPGCEAYAGLTLSAHNPSVYQETLSLLSRRVPHFGPADLHVNLAHLSPHYYANNNAFEEADPADLRRALAEALAARRRSFSPTALLERRYLGLAPRYLATGASPVPCAALSASCFVSSDGTVFPCISWDRPLGFLRAEAFDLARIWARSGFARPADGRCPGCWTPCEAFPAIAGSLWRRSLWLRPEAAGRGEGWSERA